MLLLLIRKSSHKQMKESEKTSLKIPFLHWQRNLVAFGNLKMFFIVSFYFLGVKYQLKS